MSTVASGAATMKLLSGTSIPTMSRVPVTSWVSARLPPSSAVPMALLRGFGERQLAAVEIAAGEPHHLGAAVGQQGPVGADGAREHVVDDDRRDGGREPERG